MIKTSFHPKESERGTLPGRYAQIIIKNISLDKQNITSKDDLLLLLWIKTRALVEVKLEKMCKIVVNKRTLKIRIRLQ